MQKYKVLMQLIQLAFAIIRTIKEKQHINKQRKMQRLNANTIGFNLKLYMKISKIVIQFKTIGDAFR